jgi:hypothetical protein
MCRAALGLAVILAFPTCPMRAQDVSPSRAVRWSVLGTVVPIGGGVALMGAAGNGPDASAALTMLGFLSFTGGIAAGPSLGYFAIGRPGRAWTGIGLRALGFGVTLGVVGASMSCSSGECGAAAVGVLLGSAVMLGSAIYDIATVKNAARRQLEAARGTAVSVLPTYSMSRHAAGMLVRVRF